MKRRRLSGDEHALWKRVTRDVSPMKKRASSEEGPPGVNIGETTREAMTPTEAAKPRGRAKQKPAPAKPAPARKPRAQSAFEGGDPALDKRARRGRISIDRVIDLHGMTQVAARVALASFLERAQADHCRCVLVITGKGSAIEREPFEERAPRGVIRRRFQEWIDEEPLRSLVARASPAAPKDGGAGAFYVFLKKKNARL
ncbi:MAG TPA: Smr/MutS family protein [Amphiplicatus sp.]|nr:Smr/MutS family protein [Amphiplicatus sp.]